MITTDSTFIISPEGNNLHLCRTDQLEWEEKEALGDDLFKIGDVLFSQNFHHIFRSYDYGDSWHELSVMPWVYLRATDSALFRWDYGLYRSFDYGDSWEDISENAGIQSDDNFAIGAWNDVVMINLEYDDLYLISYDEGESWTTLPTEGLPVESYFYVSEFCIQANEIWVSTSKGVYRLPVNEEAWLPVDTVTINSYAYFHEYHDTLYIGSRIGCHYYNQDDSVWIAKNDGLENPQVCAFTTWHDTLYCSTYPGIYKMNAEGSWDLWNSELSFISIDRIFAHDNDIWVRSFNFFPFFSHQSYFYRSTDNGENFHETDPGLVGVADAMIMTDSIYYLSCLNGFYISYNFGGSWIQCNDGLDTLKISSIAINSHYCYAGTPLGLYRTSNPPETWDPAPNYLGNHAVSNLAVNDTIIICKAIINEDSFAMMRSENSGDTFEYFCIDYNCNTDYSMLFTVPYFYSFSSDSSFYSVENGQEWNNIPLPVQNMYSLSFCTGENCLVLAGGFYENIINITYDLGLEWTDISEGLPQSPFSSSPINTHAVNNQKVFTAMEYKGLWYRGDLLTHIEDQETSLSGVMEVWPNPFSIELNINLNIPEQGITLVRIFDLQGRLLYQEEVNNVGRASISPKNCSEPGLYILQIYTEKQHYTAKLLRK